MDAAVNHRLQAVLDVAARDLLLVENICLIKQRCSEVTVRFDDQQWRSTSMLRSMRTAAGAVCANLDAYASG